jgi:hypothetical protein
LSKTAASSASVDIAALCELAARQRDACELGRLKVTVCGREIILRDAAAKLLAWLDKFKQVGDIVVNYDPHQLALPWAGVRFLLEVRLRLLQGSVMHSFIAIFLRNILDKLISS